MASTLLNQASATSTTNNSSLVIPVGFNIAVGTKLIITSVRSTLSAQQNGVQSISANGNTLVRDAYSARSATYDLEIHSCTVTSAIPSGSNITITWTDIATRKAAVISVWSGVGNLLSTTGNSAPGLGNTNAGPNGSVSPVTGTTSPASAGLVIGAAGFAGNAVTTPGSGFTQVLQSSTAAGSSDRGVMQEYRVSPVSSNQTVTANIASGGWAMAGAVYEESIIEQPPAQTLGSVIVSGSKKPISGMSVIVSGQKKTVTSVSVIVGGTKKSIP